MSTEDVAGGINQERTKHRLDGEDIRGEITPIGNGIVVRIKDTLKATMGGILLPDQSTERPSEGVALACGPGRRHPHTGLLIPNPVKKGESVLYGKFDGTKVNYDDEDCNLIRDDDVIMIYNGATITKTNSRPCKDYILVKTDKGELKTSAGIEVAKSAAKDLLPCSGEVVMLGEGRTTSEGTIVPPPVGIGDRVKFRDYAGNEVIIEGEEYTAVRCIDILSVL